MTPIQPHPFARFVAILGRGKTKQRSLTYDESFEAMTMILRDQVLPEQLGAFLMLLRLKEESPDEVAGFAAATRALRVLPSKLPRVDLDWSSYAGKRIQLPWFFLSIMTLVQAGYKVALHGTEGHTPGRLYTSDIVQMFGLPIAGTLSEAADQIATGGFSYIPLQAINPKLHALIGLRPILGLRTPVHSFSRMLNPLNAKTMMQGIFHRGFIEIHAQAAQRLGQGRMAVFRGEGGEIERRPNKPTPVVRLDGLGGLVMDTWPALLQDGHQPPDDVMDKRRLHAVWTGAQHDTYASAAVVGTLAIALHAMGQAATPERAQDMASALWQARDKTALSLA